MQRHESQKNGFVSDFFDYAGIYYNELFNQLDLLTHGDKVAVLASQSLTLAGTTRARPFGFQTASILESEDGYQIEIPLHYYYLPASGFYKDRIVGGGMSRHWEHVAFVPKSTRADTIIKLHGTSMYRGGAEIKEVSNRLANIRFSAILNDLVQLPPDLHSTSDGINVRQYTVTELN